MAGRLNGWKEGPEGRKLTRTKVIHPTGSSSFSFLDRAAVRLGSCINEGRD